MVLFSTVINHPLKANICENVDMHLIEWVCYNNANTHTHTIEIKMTNWIYILYTLKFVCKHLILIILSIVNVSVKVSVMAKLCVCTCVRMFCTVYMHNYNTKKHTLPSSCIIVFKMFFKYTYYCMSFSTFYLHTHFGWFHCLWNVFLFLLSSFGSSTSLKGLFSHILDFMIIHYYWT